MKKYWNYSQENHSVFSFLYEFYFSTYFGPLICFIKTKCYKQLQNLFTQVFYSLMKGFHLSNTA